MLFNLNIFFSKLANVGLSLNFLLVDSFQYGVIAYFEEKCPDGWEEYFKSSGRVIVSAGYTNDSRGEKRQLNPGETGGEYSHVMNQKELVRHFHTTGIEAVKPDYGGGSYVGGRVYNRGDFPAYQNSNTSSVGEGEPFNIMQPYIVLVTCKYNQKNELQQNTQEQIQQILGQQQKQADILESQEKKQQEILKQQQMNKLEILEQQEKKQQDILKQQQMNKLEVLEQQVQKQQEILKQQQINKQEILEQEKQNKESYQSIIFENQNQNFGDLSKNLDKTFDKILNNNDQNGNNREEYNMFKYSIIATIICFFMKVILSDIYFYKKIQQLELLLEKKQVSCQTSTAENNL